MSEAGYAGNHPPDDTEAGSTSPGTYEPMSAIESQMTRGPDEADSGNPGGVDDRDDEAQNEEAEIYAPAVERMIVDCREAISEGDLATAQKRAGQMVDTLAHRKDQDYVPSESGREALEAAIQADDFYEFLTIGSRELPQEWEETADELAEIPAIVARELRSVDEPHQITIEPASVAADSWVVRFENVSSLSGGDLTASIDSEPQGDPSE